MTTCQVLCALFWPVCLLGLTTPHAQALELRAFPHSIQLQSAADSHRVLVIAVDDEKVTRDVTNETQFQPVDPTIAQVVAGRVMPLAAGATKLVATWQDQRAEMDVQVKSFAAAPPVNFQLDVVPVFTKAGCNAGSCHGASRGQDGFNLSLFGFDPAGDYFRATREMGTRRINLAVPERSLLLQKATGTVTHTGGKRFEVDSLHYQTLRRWLSEGAVDAPTDTPTVTAVALSPDELLLRGFGVEHGLLVTAALSDGTVRDVTELAVFASSDPAVVEVDAQGTLRTASRGEAFITCRFDVHTVGTQALVLPLEDNYQPPAIEGNYIDELVGAKLEKLRYRPSEVCSDAEFLRRVTLDLNGRLPTVDELTNFVEHTAADKRAQVSAALVERPEFDDLWTAYWADIFMVRPSLQIENKPAYLYHQWLREQIATGVPFDQIVRQLLTAKGSTFENPEANFFAGEPDKDKVAENVAQASLGIRTQCAKCHNHPFDRWTMDDYYGFAAFFQRILRKQAEDYREWIIFRSGAETKHPVTGAVVPPKFLGGAHPEQTPDVDRLDQVAEWIIAPDNPYFAKNIANRVWAHFFGRGIVDPVDDARVSNPPNNPQLLAALAERLREYEFDMGRLALDIVNSQAYQRAAEHADDAPIERDFGRAAYRRLPASVLLDCISQVTESYGRFPGIAQGEPSIKVPINADANYFLQSFGRSARTSVCACESKTEPTLSQALHLLNGETTNGKIKDGKLIPRLLEAGKTPAEIVSLLYLRCLARQPTETELQALGEIIDRATSAQEGLEDVFWAILNSREFVFNR
jgi:hypothetical protein